MTDFNPQRIGDRIVLLLERDDKPCPIPVEYKPFITNPEHDWDMRIIKLKQICNQYSHPVFERFWFFGGLASIIIVPTLLHLAIVNAVVDEDRPAATRIKARWITFSLYVATFLLFVLPITIWKYLGNRRANAALRGWNEQDKAAHPDATFIPTWQVMLPGPFVIYGKLNITLPPRPKITTFDQRAYIPPYLLNTNAPPGYNYYPPTGPNSNPALVAYGTSVPGQNSMESYGSGNSDERKNYSEDIKDRV